MNSSQAITEKSRGLQELFNAQVCNDSAEKAKIFERLELNFYALVESA